MIRERPSPPSPLRHSLWLFLIFPNIFAWKRGLWSETRRNELHPVADDHYQDMFRRKENGSNGRWGAGEDTAPPDAEGPAQPEGCGGFLPRVTPRRPPHIVPVTSCGVLPPRSGPPRLPLTSVILSPHVEQSHPFLISTSCCSCFFAGCWGSPVIHWRPVRAVENPLRVRLAKNPPAVISSFNSQNLHAKCVCTGLTSRAPG